MKTLDLFSEKTFDPYDEWVDMPEFIQENKRPIQQIKVSFASYDDVKKFADIMGMNVTNKTKSTWFPHKPLTKNTKGWKDEE